MGGGGVAWRCGKGACRLSGGPSHGALMRRGLCAHGWGLASCAGRFLRAARCRAGERAREASKLPGLSSLQLADESPVVLNGFGTVVNSLGQRAKPYLPQICGTIKWRLNNKSAKIRQQARRGPHADWLRSGWRPWQMESLSEVQLRLVLNAVHLAVTRNSLILDAFSPPHPSPGASWPSLPPQAADLISRIAPVMKKCDEEKLLAHLGVVLYENLGEEYPGERCRLLRRSAASQAARAFVSGGRRS